MRSLQRGAANHRRIGGEKGCYRQESTPAPAETSLRVARYPPAASQLQPRRPR